jgi:hypothetical protein
MKNEEKYKFIVSKLKDGWEISSFSSCHNVDVKMPKTLEGKRMIGSIHLEKIFDGSRHLDYTTTIDEQMIKELQKSGLTKTIVTKKPLVEFHESIKLNVIK